MGSRLLFQRLGALFFALVAARTLHQDILAKLISLPGIRSRSLELFSSGVAFVGGWIIALVAWVVTASHWTIGQLVMVWFPTLIVGLGQLNVGVVGAQNDAMAMGARTAFQEVPGAADRQAWLAMPFTGCDGLPDTGKAWVNQNLLAATVIIPAMTSTALELVLKAIQTKTQPPESTLMKPSSYPTIEELTRALNFSHPL